jgi:carbamoyl-phosphate synthase large subunit
MSLTDLDKEYAIEVGKKLESLGFTIVATEGTQKFFEANGVNAQRVLKISEGRPNIEDMLKNGEIAMAINTSDNKSSKDDAKKIRQTVLRFSVPYFTTLAAASASLDAITAMKQEGVMSAKALQDYLAE